VTAKTGNGHDDDKVQDDAPDSAAEAAAPSGLAAVEEPPDELAALRRERDDLRDQLLRRRADFENYKKRAERERQQAATDAVAAALRDLVPSVDNLERALAAGAEGESLRQGLELTHRGLLSFLEAQGVTVEDPVGQRFDPNRHQALMHEPVPGQADGTVTEVFRKGYTYRDRLLRPALVKVAKAEGGGSGDGIH
jgi:molecular chaperone GrpE